MSLSQIRSAFTRSHIPEFLRSGVLLRQPGGDRVRVGWGPFEAQETAGDALFAVWNPDFYLSPTPWLVPAFWDEVEAGSLRQWLAEGAESRNITWAPPNQADFTRVFANLKEEMAEAGLLKAVPVVFETSEESMDTSFLAHLLSSVLNVRDPIYVYGVWRDGEGALGATPETLFTLGADGRLRTMALAGTRLRVGEPDEDEAFLLDPKERHEHQIVVDDLINVLSLFGEVCVGKTEILKLTRLLHLKTDLEVNLKSKPRIEELVRLLHPTPALGVAPRRRGLDWIRQWDDVGRRGRFGAPFSFVLPDTSLQSLVGIRNIQWASGGLQLGSGCGIVPASELQREWDELAGKRRSVKAMLGLN